MYLIRVMLSHLSSGDKNMCSVGLYMIAMLNATHCKLALTRNTSLRKYTPQLNVSYFPRESFLKDFIGLVPF